jgi:hypothetical protein
MQWHGFWWIFPLFFFVMMIVMCLFMMRRGGMGCMWHDRNMDSPETRDAMKRSRGGLVRVRLEYTGQALRQRGNRQAGIRGEKSGDYLKVSSAPWQAIPVFTIKKFNKDRLARAAQSLFRQQSAVPGVISRS